MPQLDTAAPSEAATEIRAALERARTAWNAGDLDGYLELYAPDIELHGYAPEPLGRDEVRAFYGGIFAAFPGCQLAFHEVLVDGDAATIRFTLHGRHDGPFLGVEPTGRRIAVPGITVLHFRDGRCAIRHSAVDMLGWLAQLGVGPAASTA
jgi:steroid delta-isomerase-like uncharacterized protein